MTSQIDFADVSSTVPITQTTSIISLPSFHGTPVITTMKLNGKNYASWSVAVKVWFRGQGFINYLTNEPPSTLSPTDVSRWEQVDSQLLSLLWQSIDGELQEVFNECETCRSVWSLAMEMNTSEVTRIYDVISGLNRLQLDHSGVTGLFAQTRKLMTEFGRIFPPSTDPKVIHTQREQLFIILALRALPPTYESIRAQILGSPTLPSLNETFSRLIRAAPQTDVSNSLPSQSALLSEFPGHDNGGGRSSRGRGRGVGNRIGSRGGDRRSRCSYCNKLGHVRDTCYSLHGRPPSTANAAQVVESTDSHTPPIVTQISQPSRAISEDEYTEFLRFKAAQHAPHLITSPQASSSSTACLTTTRQPTAGPWVIDSGATNHMSGNPSLFSELHQSGSFSPVTLADGSTTAVKGLGAVTTPSFSLSSVLYIPKFALNLLSVSKLAKALKCSITFDPSSVVLQDLKTRAVIGTGREFQGLYYLDGSSPTACTVVTPEHIHNRLGHPSLPNLKLMVPSLSHVSSILCESCQLGKHSRAQFPSRVNKRATAPFDLVHSDVWGPSRVVSKTGCRYFVTFIDDHSRMTWLFLMKDRSELFSIFSTFCTEIRNQFGVNVRILRSDNAKEYFSSPFVSFMTSHGIIHQSSCSHTPQQNGVAERKNRHLIETARTLLLHMHVPLCFWSDAVLTACYLINRMPSSVLHSQVPFSILFPRDDIYSLPPRVFGCVCFVHQLLPGSDKLSARSVKCIFLGYVRHQKGYRCYSPELRRFFICADVTFFESIPFYSPSSRLPSEVCEQLPLPAPPFTPAVSRLDRPDLLTYSRRPKPSQVSPPVLPVASLPTLEPSVDLPVATPNMPPLPDSVAVPHCPSSPGPSSPVECPSDLDLPIALRKGKRTCTTSHPLHSYLTYSNLSPGYHALVSSLSSVSIPTSVHEALRDSGWRAAMVDEMNALHSNDTWDLIPLPSGKSIVGCRWVFTVKVSPDGTIDRLKARLVAKGFTQVYGQDYDDTFSPVAKIASIRILFSLAAQYDWPLHQLDVKNAFLNGVLHEEVYMEQPPGFVAQGEYGPNTVCRLKKALYGLKQSPRAWFGRFSEVVQQFGLLRSMKDHSVFYRHSSTGTRILLIVYVDDILITGDDSVGIQDLKKFLHSQFQTKDLGPLRYFLGIEVARSNQGIFTSQRKYALDMLTEVGMLGCRPCDSPMDPNQKLLSNVGDLCPDPGKYRRLVGKLNYLTVTRPDISFAVSVVSQFLDSPRVCHWDAVVRILRYIKAAPGRGILYKNQGHNELLGYSDADWAGSPIDRRSTSGYCVFLGGNLISWKSKKQNVVARSSAEAEYRAMALATCELLWVKHLLTEIGEAPSTSMKLLCDNQAALHIASNPVFHERTKHIEIDCHFIREKLLQGDLVTSFVSSSEQLADLFTKSLRGTRVNYICNKLGTYDIYAPA